MSTERPTKAAMQDLTERAEHAEARTTAIADVLETVSAERDAWREVKITDPEAEAISGCVRAIEAMSSENRIGGMVGIGHGGYRPAPTAEQMPIGRVLLHLAARYGVPLYDVTADEPDAIVRVPASVAEAMIDGGQASRV